MMVELDMPEVVPVDPLLLLPLTPGVCEEEAALDGVSVTTSTLVTT